MPTLSQAEADDVCRKHKRFISGLPDGLRGNLSWRNLSGLKLAGRDLTGADLTGALLFGANLKGTKLDGASLYGADLQDALQHAEQTIDATLNRISAGISDFGRTQAALGMVAFL